MFQTFNNPTKTDNGFEEQKKDCIITKRLPSFLALQASRQPQQQYLPQQ